jgi:hypothetical protein
VKSIEDNVVKGPGHDRGDVLSGLSLAQAMAVMLVGGAEQEGIRDLAGLQKIVDDVREFLPQAIQLCAAP